MIKDNLNGLMFKGDMSLIKSIIIHHGCCLIDDETKKPIRIIGIVKNGLGQIGCMLDQEMYTLRSVYIDENNVPHLSVCAIGGAIIDNNIENYNLRTISEYKSIGITDRL